jgi:hypothetical protein
VGDTASEDPITRPLAVRSRCVLELTVEESPASAPPAPGLSGVAVIPVLVPDEGLAPIGGADEAGTSFHASLVASCEVATSSADVWSSQPAAKPKAAQKKPMIQDLGM